MDFESVNDDHGTGRRPGAGSRADRRCAAASPWVAVQSDPFLHGLEYRFAASSKMGPTVWMVSIPSSSSSRETIANHAECEPTRTGRDMVACS